MSDAHSSMTTLAARGDDQALAAVMRAYRARVYRYGTRVCRDPADADDAVQDAFMRLARRQDVMAHAGVLGWLRTVVRNTCRRLMRPFARERRVLGARIDDADTLATEQPTPEQALAQWQLVERVHAAIRALEPGYRAVLVLRDLEGYSGEETCDVLGLELATMKTRLHRARAQLRAALGRTDPPKVATAATPT